MFFRQLQMKLEDFEKKGKSRVLGYFVRVFNYLPNKVHFHLCHILPKLFRRFCNHFPEGCRSLYLCHQMILRAQFQLVLSQFLFILFDLWVFILCLFLREPNLLKDMLLLVQSKSFRSFLLLWIWKTERSSARRNNHITDFVVSFVVPLVHFFKKIYCWCCELKDRTNGQLLLYRFVCRWLLTILDMFEVFLSWFCFEFNHFPCFCIHSFEIITICSLFWITLRFFRLRLDAYGIFRMFDECSQ